MPGLADTILEQHRRGRRGRDADWKPDHVLLGPAAARFVLPIADALDPGAPLDVPAVAWTERAAGPTPGFDDARDVFDTARGLRVPLLPAVGGACELPFREGVAAPGRLIVTCGIPDVALGALGLVACAASPFEATALLRGLSGWQPPEALTRVAFEGEAIHGVEGADVALDLLRRQPAARWTGARIECFGLGIASLPLAERIAIAHLLGVAGAAAVVFPSDVETREAFRAWKRDSDWRELAADGAAEPIVMDLTTVEPLVAPWTDLALARGLRQMLGRKLRGVMIGPLADELDFARFAALLVGAPVAAGLEVVAMPGSVALATALDSSGVRAELEHAGVRYVDPAGTWEAPRGAAARGTWIGVGLSRAIAEALPGALAGSTAACAAAARAGALADPRDLPEEGWRPVTRAPMPRAGFNAPDFADAADGRVPIRTTAPGGSLRAVVWIEVGDDCTAERVIGRASRGRPAAAAEAGEVLPWVRREELPVGPDARLVVVAGRAFGYGGGFDPAGWLLSRSGVRAVIAAGVDPDTTRSLAYAGILPLIATAPGPRQVAAPGEEIEIPSLPEALEPGLPVGVRNLTRGTQHTLRHDLDARLVAVWRDGGLLGGRLERV